MSRLAALLAMALAWACSSSDEGPMAAPQSEKARASAPLAVLTGRRPLAAFQAPDACAGGDLVLDVTESRGAAAAPVAWSLTVTGDGRALATFTPYPTGEGGSVRIARDRCAGVERIAVEAKPVHGEALPADLRIEIALRASD